MSFSTLDWWVIGGLMLIFILPGLLFGKSSGKSLADFFLSGRNMPWYLAGISMVATTFAADTPLAVAEIVGSKGVSGNWLWWSFLFGGTLTTFFFAHLWRRSGVVTENELISLRYSGEMAKALRPFKAIYLGVFLNSLVIAWVNLAFMSLITVFFGIEGTQLYLITGAAMLLVAIYSSISGIKGIALADSIQFFVAMTGCIILAIYVLRLPEVGGIAGLKAKIPAETLSFFPKIGGETSALKTFSLSIGAFLAFVTMQWWASWYPGNEPGGGGYVAQRMLSAKSEKDAVWATLFFQVAHYALRPWPWIIVGLAGFVLYPEIVLENPRMTYVYAMRDHLPNGLKGLLFAAFLAAYMSTISTQLNLGASFIVNDVIKPFGDLKERQLVLWSRLATFILMALGLIISTKIESISGVWQFIMECGAGLGGVLILRWYWWRINAWSEITAIIAPFIGYALAHYAFDWVFPNSFFFTVGFTTFSWVAVTFLTPATTSSTLKNFYDTIKPGGFWKPFQVDMPSTQREMRFRFLAWISATIFVFSALFGIGYLIFDFRNNALICLVSILMSGFILNYAMRKQTIS